MQQKHIYLDLISIHNLKVFFLILSIATFVASCSKEENQIIDDNEMGEVIAMDTIPYKIGAYAPFYLNSFWEYKNTEIVYNDLLYDNEPDSTITYRYYRQTILKDTVIANRTYRVILNEHFEDENFQTLKYTNTGFQYHENNAYFGLTNLTLIENTKYLDLEGASWYSDTTSSPYPGGTIYEFDKYSVIEKDTAVTVNNQIYDEVVIVGIHKYNKLDANDDFHHVITRYKYYAKDIGLIFTKYNPPFRKNYTELINTQIND